MTVPTDRHERLVLEPEPDADQARSPLDDVPTAIAAIAAGRPVVVVDDESRENEGDVIIAADAVTPEVVAFMMTECRGLICAPMPGEALDRLGLAPMTHHNTEPHGTAFTVSVDARDGITTGISAADRCRTLRLLAEPACRDADLTRPGHMFPLRANDHGVLGRPGHTEAAVDLARLAGRAPVGAICEVVNADGTMSRLPQLVAFARRHGMPIISVADLITHRRRTERLVERVGDTVLPTVHGVFRALGYRESVTGDEHVALVAGELREGALADGEDVLVRVHSECLTGDVFGSRRCDCGPQLAASLNAVAAEGRGVVLYHGGHEGRGIGLLAKLRAYSLQDRGHDTVDANRLLGLAADARDYGTAAQILRDLGVRTARLLTNNPAKQAGLTRYGLAVSRRIPLPVSVTEHNLRYLRTKRDRMGHELPGLDKHPGA